MHTHGLADFLIRTVLDIEFRDLVMSDPEKAFEGYQLSTETREILSSRDPRVLTLLSNAFQESWSPADTPVVGESESHPAPVPTQTLPELRLSLSLIPHVLESADEPPESDIQLNYEASLHPWPQAATGREEAGGELDQQSPSDGRVDLLVRIVPSVISAPGESPKIAYAATIQAPGAMQTNGPQANLGRLEAGPEPDAAESVSPDSLYASAIQALVDDVRQASPDDRFQKLLKLIRFQQEGGRDGA